MKDEFKNSPDFLKLQDNFQKEAERLKRCTYPHIVKIYDLFLEENLWSIISLGIIRRNSKLCMVMEYVSGEDLDSVISRRGALPEAEALKYIQQVGNALKTVHEQGLLHRDIKPKNIMLREDKSAILIDFGIAREFIHDRTLTHTVMFTPFYAPPEQLNPKAKQGTYTDIYALAATLYVLLIGGVPKDWTYGGKLEPPKYFNSNISDRVNQAVVKGLKCKPEDRPQSVQEWLQMLVPKLQVKPTDVNPWVCLQVYFVFWLATSSVYTSLLLISNNVLPFFGADTVREGYSTLVYLAFICAVFSPSSNIKNNFIRSPIIFGFFGIIEGLVTSISNNFNDIWFLTLRHTISTCFEGLIVLGVSFAISGSAKTGLQIHFNGFMIFIIVMGVSLLGIVSSWIIHVWS